MHQIFTKTLITALNVGVMLSATHTAFAAATMPSTTIDFSAKVHAELHTHHEQGNTHKPISDQYVDPKSLRRVRSEGDKVAERDREMNGWDVYSL